jgi:hypothetical protein
LACKSRKSPQHCWDGTEPLHGLDNEGQDAAHGFQILVACIDEQQQERKQAEEHQPDNRAGAAIEEPNGVGIFHALL